MATPTSGRLRGLGAGLRALLVLTVILGICYPLAMTGIAQAVLGDKADGSPVRHDGREVGSRLLGQSFDLVDARGNPRLFGADGREVAAHEAPGGTTTYTWLDNGAPLTEDEAAPHRPAPPPARLPPRPSPRRHDPLTSGASNYGAENPEFVALVQQRREQVAAFNGVPQDRVPADAVLASGSGLDPHISRAYALLQVDRVARERGLDPAAVRRLVDRHVDGRVLGFLGEPGVHVLELTIAVARAGAR